MVEFGLKLEDNKVSEWSDKYIDYEALKKILKKASAAVKKKDELCKRKPELADEIVAAYKQGKGPNLMSPATSQDGLNLLTEMGNVGMPIAEEETDTKVVVDQVPTSELAPLVTTNKGFGSHGTMASNTVDSLSGHISRTISGYFTDSKYERRIRESLDEIENLESRFDESIHQQVRNSKVCGCIQPSEEMISL